MAAGVRPGDVLAGKYRVERVIGAGGMGVVVAAHHLQLDEKVALKFLRQEALSSQEAVGRFVREARAAAKIKGEHVARVSDVGQLETGSPYIVMEYLEGMDLSSWLKQRGPLPIDLAVDFVLQSCEAIADAHVLGIVHRDLKPANLFCVERSDGTLSIKVLDFGISKVITPGASGHDMTRTSAVVGSPFYMSPEQIMSSRDVDVRTDIWSLGVILHELLVGQPPFAGEAITELAVRITIQAATPVQSYRPDVPAGLDQVITRCLEKDRERRYPNVAELALALADFGTRRARQSVEGILGTMRKAGITGIVLPPSGVHRAMPPSPGPSSGPSMPSVPTASAWGQTGATTNGNRSLVLGGLVVATLAVLLAGGVLVGRSAIARRAAARSHPSAAATTSTTPPLASVAPLEDSADVPTVAVTDLPSAAPPAGSSAPVLPPVPAGPRVAPAVTAPVATATQAAPAARAGCNPPYEFDSEGNKKWKRQCL